MHGIRVVALQPAGRAGEAHLGGPEQRLRQAQEQAQRILGEATGEAQKTVLAARDQAMQIRNEAQAEIDRWRNNLRREEERLQQRREKLDQRQEALDKREQMLNKRQSALDRQRNELERLQEERTRALEEVARMTQEEARQELLNLVAEGTRQDMARVIREIEQEARDEGERRARKILANVIQRMASEQVAELTVSSVDLPSDEMKGRIIGRGGRNIRTFEQIEFGFDR